MNTLDLFPELNSKKSMNLVYIRDHLWAVLCRHGVIIIPVHSTYSQAQWYTTKHADILDIYKRPKFKAGHIISV